MKGSPAGEELAAPIINEKYAMDLPLYRIEDALFDKKAAISRQTMSNRLISVSDCYLTPLYECMKEHLLAMDIIHADETPVQTLHHQDVSTNVRIPCGCIEAGLKILIS